MAEGNNPPPDELIEKCIYNSRKILCGVNGGDSEAKLKEIFNDLHQLLVLPVVGKAQLEEIFYYVISHIGDAMENNDQFKFPPAAVKIMNLYVDKVIPKFAEVDAAIISEAQSDEQNASIWTSWHRIFHLFHKLKTNCSRGMSTPSLPYIFSRSKLPLYNSEFKTCEKEDHVKGRVVIEFSNVEHCVARHSTSSDDLASILMSANNTVDLNPTSMPMHQNLDTCLGDILFCPVTNDELDNEGDYAGGICAIKFNFFNMLNNPRFRWYKRGTNKHTRRSSSGIVKDTYIQKFFVLDTEVPGLENEGGKLYFVNEDEQDISCSKEETDISKFQWEMSQCKNNEEVPSCSTIAEIGFLTKLCLQVSQLEESGPGMAVLKKIEFLDNHKCDNVDNNCFDCQWHSEGLSLYRAIDGDGEGSSSHKREKLFIEGQSDIKEFSMKHFALRCSMDTRSKIKALQIKSKVFGESDFAKIEKYWNDYPFEFKFN